MCLCNSGIYCWGCVFLTTASPYKGANLSCAGRRQMMSCFLCFSPLSSCCRKAGLEVNTSLCKGRAGAAASGWAGWVLQEQNDGHGISGLAFPLLPPSMGSPSTRDPIPMPCSGWAGAQQVGALCLGTAQSLQSTTWTSTPSSKRALDIH